MVEYVRCKKCKESFPNFGNSYCPDCMHFCINCDRKLSWDTRIPIITGFLELPLYICKDCLIIFRKVLGLLASGKFKDIKEIRKKLDCEIVSKEMWKTLLFYHKERMNK